MIYKIEQKTIFLLVFNPLTNGSLRLLRTDATGEGRDAKSPVRSRK